MTTTWISSGPIQHPWFSQPSMKRKLSGSPSPVSSPSRSSSSSASSSPPPPKRRKHSALEAGFSTLSLHTTNPCHGSSSMSYVSEPVSAVEDFSAMEDDPPTDMPLTFVIRPSSIEEPSIPEVKMKSSSWYEPEPDRIVITDLDSSDDEDDENADPDTASLSISRALLKRISEHSRDLTTPGIPPRPVSQALVLFKPLPMAGVANIASVEDKAKEESIGIVDVVGDDDAMDVEVW